MHDETPTLSRVEAETVPNPMLQRYLDTLIRLNHSVDARGLLHAQPLHELALEHIYVPLTLRLEDNLSELRDDLREMEIHRQFLEENEEQDNTAEVLLREQRHGLARETGLALEMLWDRGDHWVVLGAPGSGKTTLLKYLGLTRARELRDSGQGDLPIHLNLNKFARAWQAHPEWPTNEALIEYLGGPAQEELGLALDPHGRQSLLSSFKLSLAGHNALLLVDGLDTVHEAELRHSLTDAVDALLRRYPGNRCLLACRVLDDQLTLFSRGFGFATLEPFDLEQVRRFFRQWIFAVEQQEDLVVDAATRLNAERKAADLLARLEERPQICLQVSNPLLCTLIGLVYRQVGSLPEQQVELYKLCVDHFILQWEILKRQHCLVDGSPNRDQTREILEAVALALHRARGENRAKTAWLSEIVETCLRQEHALAETESRQAADQFMDLVRLDTGLLVNFGEDEYGFFHLTFQEYLAARRLTRGIHSLRAFLAEHLFDPHWRGVVRLAAAHQGMKGEQEGSAFVEAVENQAHPREAIMHYAFRLAFLCMRMSRVHFETADRLFEMWVKLYLEEPELQPALNRLLRQTHGMLRYKPRALLPLLDALNHEDASVRGKAAEALGNLKDGAAVPALLTRFREDSQPLVRARAAEALGSLRAGEAVDSLLKALREDGAFFVRRQAAQALGNLQDPAALPALLGALRDAEPATRWRAAEALGNLKDSTAVPVLLETLRREKVAGVRWRIAEALGQLKEPLALPELIAILKQDPDPLVRSRAAEALGGYKPMESLTALLEALENDSYPAVRWRAAESLGRLKDPLAVPVLLTALRQDVDNAVRWSSAEALGRLKSPQAVPALLAALEEDLDPPVRWSAAESLGLLRDRQALPLLFKAMREDRYASVRGKAAQALGYLRDPGATPALLQVLQDDRDASVRRQAAEALGCLGDASALPILLETLLKDQESSVRWHVAEALGNLKDERAIPGLVRVLREDPDMSVRRRAAQTLEIIDLGCLL